MAELPTRGSVFIPGVFFLALGVLALLAPWLVAGVVAAILLFLGAVFSFLAWKVLQLKKRFDAFSRQLQGSIIIQHRTPTSVYVEDIEVIEDGELMDLPRDQKKIVYH